MVVPGKTAAPGKSALTQKLRDWNLLIRSGRGDLVQEALAKLLRRHVAPVDRAPLAQLAWRCGAPLVGVRLLAKVLRPTSGAPSRATPDEIAEYGACLAQLGATQEALELFAGLDPARYPKVLLYEAIARAKRWDYELNIGLLRRFLSGPPADAYQTFVARVNLASALVNEGKHTAATALIRGLLFDTALRKHVLLLGNLYEIAAERFLLLGQPERAVAVLSEAQKALGRSRSIYAFLTRKWQAIAGVMKAPGSPEARDRLHAIRQEARAIGHWETLRECDRFEAIATKNFGLLVHLYFGTPHAGLRRRLAADLAKRAPLPADYSWRVDGNGATGKPVVLDLLTGAAGRGIRLKPGRLPHRLLVALSSDFYRPIPLGELHGALFPKEYFNPQSSPARVHKAVSLLRAWLERHRLPLKIEESSAQYRLSATAPCLVKIPGEAASGASSSLPLVSLRRAWPGGTFSAEEAAKVLRASDRTTRRQLGEAVAAGKLLRLGTRRGARYRFP